jgi:hypothetical protein
MSRYVIALLLVPSIAAAEAPGDRVPTTDFDDQQSIGADIGAAAGGNVTAGGLRVGGHYLYQLSDQDWFDGAANFTFGSGAAACFHDRMAKLVCDHGLAQGTELELAAGIRRIFAPRGQFQPFARALVGLGLVRFGGDNVTGFAVPLHLGGGVRTEVAPSVSIVVQAELAVGFARFNQGIGTEPQFGVALSAGAEFRLN